MIDTDKYEGHAPAPWGWRHKVAEYRLTANGDKEWIDGIRANEDTDPTVMALIADAPKLLAEVKRLRKENEYFRGLLDHYKGELIMLSEALYVSRNEKEEEE